MQEIPCAGEADNPLLVAMRGQPAGGDPPYRMRWWPAPGQPDRSAGHQEPLAQRPAGDSQENKGTWLQERPELIDGETVPGGELLRPSKD